MAAASGVDPGDPVGGPAAEGLTVKARETGVKVLVLDETPADKTYQILVTHPGYRPFQYVVARADVVARDPFVLPIDGQQHTAP